MTLLQYARQGQFRSMVPLPLGWSRRFWMETQIRPVSGSAMCISSRGIGMTRP